MCGRFALGIDGDDVRDRLQRQLFIPRRPRRNNDRRAPSAGSDDEQDEEENRDDAQDEEEEEEQRDDDQEDGDEAQVAWADEQTRSSFRKRFNIPPKVGSQQLKVDLRAWLIDTGHYEKSNSLILRRKHKSGKQAYELELDQWGLIPSWSKEPPSGPMRTINATCEKVFEGSSLWASVRGTKRCIIVAQGFYEWQTKGKDKLPHFIRPADGRLLCMAGFWDHTNFDGAYDPVTTFTIVTVPANKQMQALHHRMPAIIEDPGEIALWLSDQKWNDDIAKLVRPYEGQLDIYQVPKEVGKVGNESSTFIEPVKQAKGSLESMFAKQSPVKKDDSAGPSSSAKKEEEQEEPSSFAPKKESPQPSSSSSKKGKRSREASIEVVDLLDESDEDADAVDQKPKKKMKKAKKGSKPSSPTGTLDDFIENE